MRRLAESWDGSRRMCWRIIKSDFYEKFYDIFSKNKHVDVMLCSINPKTITKKLDTDSYSINYKLAKELPLTKAL